MKLKLYEITEGIANILQAEEWDKATEARVEALGLDLEQKAENIARYLADQGGFVAIAKAEEQRIAARRKAAENRVASLKEYLHSCLDHAGRTEVAAGTFTVKIQKTGGSAIPDNEALTPAKYVETEEVTKVDRSTILKDLRKGIAVDGWSLKPGTSLRIR